MGRVREGIYMTEYKMPVREENSNKGTFGKVLNFSGSKNYIGAAYLSTVSILKAGGGFAALATEKDIIKSVSTLLPEAVYLSRKEGLNKIKDFSVILIGCGLGLERKSKNLFKKIIKSLQNFETPTIIDADGLNILSELYQKSDKEILLYAQNKKKSLIITPHPLEAARLLGIKLEEILADLVGSAIKLAERYNCVAVLKTHRTIITDGKNLFTNQHGNSALAKAGSGDVLAGIIAGLLAGVNGVGVNGAEINKTASNDMQTKTSLFEAAKLGVYLHSRAGEIASEELTKYSVLASELPEYLHKAIAEIC